MARTLFLAFVFTLIALPGRFSAGQQDPLEGFSDPVGQLNRMLPSVPDDRRADLILGRALGETQPMPAGLEAMDSVNLLVPGDPEWDAAEAWAAGEPQQAALEALRTATDRRADMAFALPYGDTVPADLRRVGFWVEIEGDKAYAAEFHYTDWFDRLHALAWVEANRLAEKGEGMDAAELLVSMVRLGRMLCDRPLFFEAGVGYDIMLDSCEQLRDLVYRNQELLDTRDTKRVARLLEERTLRIDRIKFPEGGETVTLQAILDSFERMGNADPDAVASILETATEGLSDILEVDTEQANYFDTVETARRVFADWRLRWPLDVYDLIMDRPSFFTSIMATGPQYAVVLAAAGPQDILFELRLRVRTELIGTRLSLGAVGYRNAYGAWPKPLVAIRPAFVSEIDIDPYDPLQADQMRYFVPIRDQAWGPRETPHPHTLRVHHDLEGLKYGAMAGKAAMRLLPEQAALESMKAFTAALTSLSVEPSNVDEKTDSMDRATLIRLIPPHLQASAQDLDDDHLRVLANYLAGTTVLTPEYAELKKAYGVSPDSGQRNRGRNRRRGDETDSRELATLARAFAIALSESGVPLARRLMREQTADPSVAMFDVVLDEDSFVVYSVGNNGTFEWGEQSGLDGTDFLYWPPVLSLYREHTGG